MLLFNYKKGGNMCKLISVFSYLSIILILFVSCEEKQNLNNTLNNNGHSKKVDLLLTQINDEHSKKIDLLTKINDEQSKKIDLLLTKIDESNTKIKIIESEIKNIKEQVLIKKGGNIPEHPVGRYQFEATSTVGGGYVFFILDTKTGMVTSHRYYDNKQEMRNPMGFWGTPELRKIYKKEMKK